MSESVQSNAAEQVSKAILDTQSEVKSIKQDINSKIDEVKSLFAEEKTKQDAL